MKNDLDRLMKERGLDALVVMGKMNGNPPLYYISNGAKVIRAHVFKKLGEEPLLLCSPIDRVAYPQRSGVPKVQPSRPVERGGNGGGLCWEAYSA